MVNESENKDTDAVAGLLGSLPRVEAPNDFDFRVKARIAAGQPAKIAWFPSVARVAVPLGLVLSVGGYFGYRSIYQAAATDVATVAKSQTDSTVPTAPAIEISTLNATTPSPDDVGAEKMVVKPPVVDDKMLASSNSSITKPTASGGILTTNGGGGSFDESVKESKTIFPRGINPHNRIVVKPRDFDQPGSITAKDLLTQFGADVVYSGNGWRIAAVKENSTAQKAGLKIGDVIEAINDQPIGERTSFKGQFSGKSIRLKREGATVTIDLSKKP